MRPAGRVGHDVSVGKKDVGVDWPQYASMQQRNSSSSSKSRSSGSRSRSRSKSSSKAEDVSKTAVKAAEVLGPSRPTAMQAAISAYLARPAGPVGSVGSSSPAGPTAGLTAGPAAGPAVGPVAGPPVGLAAGPVGPQVGRTGRTVVGRPPVARMGEKLASRYVGTVRAVGPSGPLGPGGPRPVAPSQAASLARESSAVKEKSKEPGERKKPKRPRAGPVKPPKLEEVPSSSEHHKSEANLCVPRRSEKEKEKKSRTRNPKLKNETKERKLKARATSAKGSKARKLQSSTAASRPLDRKAQAKAKCTSFLMRFLAGRKGKTSRKAPPEEVPVNMAELIRKRDEEKTRIFGNDPLIVSSSDDDA
mmetsp:Transcript_68268/g.158433  ORF Transcript_68268/g.158433 Transcript_68268/m.158433 type:complete len:362 (-) Transcript_68268:31-1116(-)